MKEKATMMANVTVKINNQTEETQLMVTDASNAHTVEYERPALRNDRVMRTPTFIEFIVVAIPRW
eukprot:CAMPEP_0171324190 /NCGR_PEP_ID=MMETSP0816-20121228/116033_1 /TAXON_ID=420281 /ORGANISM="Proboscia inermis, Strain CCAP1064/1" /LENGTH=64 /DNA_ID=CAMNT_0011823065 /DNA_START=566 /DNA_END=757 /DNA_ORIENTATION=+